MPLDMLRGLPRLAPREPGIYFLWRGPQLLYIGSSMEDIGHRMQTHIGAKRGTNRHHPRYPFTHYTCFQHRRRGLHELELGYIRAYDPPFNTRDGYTWTGKKVPFTRDDYSPVGGSSSDTPGDKP